MDEPSDRLQPPSNTSLRHLRASDSGGRTGAPVFDQECRQRRRAGRRSGARSKRSERPLVDARVRERSDDHRQTSAADNTRLAPQVSGPAPPGGDRRPYLLRRPSHGHKSRRERSCFAAAGGRTPLPRRAERPRCLWRPPPSRRLGSSLRGPFVRPLRSTASLRVGGPWQDQAVSSTLGTDCAGRVRCSGGIAASAYRGAARRVR